MDNYLSSRWPEGMAAQPESEHREKKPRKEKRKKKARRVWLDVLIIVLALAVLCGLVAGSFFGIQYVAEKFVENLPDQSDLPDLPDGAIPVPTPTQGMTQEDLWSADMLPQGMHDPSVQMVLRSKEGCEVLSAQEIYRKVLPSIVCVEAYNEAGYSVGSGIVVSESGYIITNYHIIEGGTGLGVATLTDLSYYDATLVGYDKELDLAVLKAEGGSFIPAEFGSSDELQVGDPVYAIGCPMGYLRGAMSDGIVSYLGDRVAELDYSGRLIQTTAALNSGNSGGALVDAYGRVVGITYAKVTGIRNDTVVEGLGLAIPMSDARSYLNRILRTGDSARPSLGIQCLSPVEVDGVIGIQVVEATVGTPAHGKLLPNDLIIEANGIRVYAVDDVIRILSDLDPGDEVELTLIRKGKEQTVTVALYDRLSELQ